MRKEQPTPWPAWCCVRADEAEKMRSHLCQCLTGSVGHVSLLCWWVMAMGDADGKGTSERQLQAREQWIVRATRWKHHATSAGPPPSGETPGVHVPQVRVTFMEWSHILSWWTFRLALRTSKRLPESPLSRDEQLKRRSMASAKRSTAWPV